jgi:cytochrome c oxidase assembly factor CtaG
MAAVTTLGLNAVLGYQGTLGQHGKAAYTGPPELTVGRAFSSWVLDPWALAFIVLLAVVYLVGIRAVRQAGERWPAIRVVFFGFGLGFAVLATMSFVGVYRPVLFYARSVQTVLLLLVVPLFLALSRPVTLAIAALPRGGPRIQRALKTKFALFALFPAIPTAVLVMTPFVVYFTAWYGAGFDSVAVRELTYLVFLAPGFVFFWTLLRVDPVPRNYPYVVSMWISAAEIIGDAILGLAIIADPSLIAGAYYHLIARPWGPNPATDQILGGGTIWVLGDVVGLPFLVAQLIQMIREDEKEAKVIDAELDAVDAAEADADAQLAVASAAAGAPEPGPATDAGGRRLTPSQRPWWESDSRFAERFHSVDESSE